MANLENFLLVLQLIMWSISIHCSAYSTCPSENSLESCTCFQNNSIEPELFCRYNSLRVMILPRLSNLHFYMVRFNKVTLNSVEFTNVTTEQLVVIGSIVSNYTMDYFVNGFNANSVIFRYVNVDAVIHYLELMNPQLNILYIDELSGTWETEIIKVNFRNFPNIEKFSIQNLVDIGSVFNLDQCDFLYNTNMSIFEAIDCRLNYIGENCLKFHTNSNLVVNLTNNLISQLEFDNQRTNESFEITNFPNELYLDLSYNYITSLNENTYAKYCNDSMRVKINFMNNSIQCTCADTSWVFKLDNNCRDHLLSVQCANINEQDLFSLDYNTLCSKQTTNLASWQIFLISLISIIFPLALLHIIIIFIVRKKFILRNKNTIIKEVIERDERTNQPVPPLRQSITFQGNDDIISICSTKTPSYIYPDNFDGLSSCSNSMKTSNSMPNLKLAEDNHDIIISKL